MVASTADMPGQDMEAVGSARIKAEDVLEAFARALLRFPPRCLYLSSLL